MSSQPPWQEDDTEAPPWEVDDTAASPKKPSFGLRGSTIKAQPGFWGKVGQDVKDFGSEIPLMGFRALDLLRGKTNDPALEAERASRTRKINEMLGAAPEDSGPEMRFGRVAARMVPGAAAAVLTGGQSLPVQAGVQGLVQGLQTASEGGDAGTVATGAGLAALGPLLGAGVNRFATKAKNPFASSVDRATADAAGRLGLDLPASALTNSSRARGLEQVASRMLGGGKIEGRGLQAIQDIGEKAGALSAGADSTVAGEAVAGDYAARRGALQAAKNAEYGKVGDLTKIPANAEDTLAFIDKMLAEGTAAPDVLESLRKLRQSIAPVPEEIGKDLRKALAQIPDTPAGRKLRERLLEEGRRAGEVTPARDRAVNELMSQQAGLEYGGPNALQDKALANRLRAALGKDYTTALEAGAPDQAAQLAAAKGAYGKYADLTDSTVGRTVASNVERGTVDKIPEGLLRSTASRQDLQRLVEVSTPETRQELQRVLLRQIVGNGQTLTPKAIEGALKKYRNLDVILDPEQIQRLKDLSAVRLAMGKTVIGSPTAPLTISKAYLDKIPKVLRGVAAAGGSLAGVPGAVAAAGTEMGAEALIARILGSEGGQKWLTTGLGPATLPGRLAQAPLTAGARIPSELSLEQRRRRAELDALLAGAEGR